MSPSFLMIEVCIMIEMTLTAFKLGMGDEFRKKRSFSFNKQEPA